MFQIHADMTKNDLTKTDQLLEELNSQGTLLKNGLQRENKNGLFIKTELPSNEALLHPDSALCLNNKPKETS